MKAQLAKNQSILDAKLNEYKLLSQRITKEHEANANKVKKLTIVSKYLSIYIEILAYFIKSFSIQKGVQ